MTERHHAWLLWLGLTIASSPALAGLAQSLRDEAAHRYTLLAWLLLVVLLAWGTKADGPPMRRLGPGAALVLFGWAAQLLGTAAAAGFIANVGLALSIFGLALYVGRPAPATLVLAFGLIPVPGFVYAMGSPAVESALGEASGRVLGLIGLPVESGGPLLRSGGMRFEIVATDVGLVTAICAAEFAWFASLRRGDDLVAGLARTGKAAAAGILLQPLLVVLAAASLPLGRPDLGRFLLSHGVPISLALAVLVTEIRRP